MFCPRASYFPEKESSQSSPGLRARTRGRPTGDVCLVSGAQNLTLLPRLPGLPGPGWEENKTSLPLSFRACVSELCAVVPVLAALPRCAAPDSVAVRTGRPRRATAVKRSKSKFCSLSWWGYKVSPVKRTKFLSRTGRVGPIRFCKVRPTQGRWPPVTGSGGKAIAAEGIARGRPGRPPAILWFLSDRSERNSPRRAKSPTSKTLVPPAGDIAQEAAGDDSPCRGEMAEGQRGEGRFPLSGGNGPKGQKG